MSTKSIVKSIIIRDDKGAKAFLDAINGSRRAQKKNKEPKANAGEMSREEIRRIFGKK